MANNQSDDTLDVDAIKKNLAELRNLKIQQHNIALVLRRRKGDLELEEARNNLKDL